MIILPKISRNGLFTIIGAMFMVCTVLAVSAPQFASAQTTGGGIGNAISTAVGNAITGTLNGPNGGQPTVCDGGWRATFEPTCWGRSLAAGLAAVIIQIAVWILQSAGLLFNLLVDHTIIRFGDVFYGAGVKLAVETAWTAFRDISNIVIIGMFVFVAISTILGNVEYGAKKWVAKIIIIAVLINFSLLFTKVIIDFSNFAALQFYNAAALQTGDTNTATGGATANQPAQKGIAGAFLNYMGVTGFSDGYAAVRQAAESNDSGGIALLHGIISAFFLLAAAVVLFYGSFLLASRALLLIFLLLTSSIAFATYLIPIGVVNTKFGWSSWWSSLLQSAVFAPLLMIFLWVTLAVGKALKEQAGTLGTQGTLGDLLSNPTKGANLEAFFGYIIVLGLLFISFKISSSFSTSIGGFNYAAMLPAGIAGAGSQLLGMAGRQTIGRFSYKAGEALQKQSQDPGHYLGTRKLFDFAAKPFKATAKQDFNALRNSFGSNMAKTAGLKPSTLTGSEKPIGGYAGERDKMLAKDAEKLARMGITSEKALKDAENVGKKPGAPASPVERPPLMDKPIPTVDKKGADAVRSEELKEYLNARPEEKKVHEKAQEEVRISKEDLDALRRQNSDSMASLSQSIKGLREQQTTLRSNKADTVAIARADEIEKEISKSKVETSRSLKQRNEQIMKATEKSQVADEELRKIEKRAMDAIKDRAQTQEEQNSKQKEAGTSVSTNLRTFSETINKTRGAFESANSKEKYIKDVFEKMRSQLRDKKRQPMIKAAQDAAKAEVKNSAPPASGGDKH